MSGFGIAIKGRAVSVCVAPSCRWAVRRLYTRRGLLVRLGRIELGFARLSTVNPPWLQFTTTSASQ